MGSQTHMAKEEMISMLKFWRGQQLSCRLPLCKSARLRLLPLKLHTLLQKKSKSPLMPYASTCVRSARAWNVSTHTCVRMQDLCRVLAALKSVGNLAPFTCSANDTGCFV